MLSPASAAKFGLKLGALDPRIEIRGATGEAEPHITTVQTLTFIGVPFRGVDFLVSEHALGGPVDGLIGQNVLGGPDVEYDFAGGVIAPLPAEGLRRRLAGLLGAERLGRTVDPADGPVGPPDRRARLR